MKNLRDLLEHQIKDLYSAETQLIKALPNVIEATTNRELKKAIQDHLEETKEQKERLERVAEILNMDPKGETCKAMKGLVKETSDMIDEDATDAVRDAGLICDAQRVEHYEIAGYGSAVSFAKQLNLNEVAEILSETLQEEKNADNKLAKIATSTVNQKAEAAR